MTAKQTKIVAAGGVAAVVLVALAWFFGVSPQLSNANESKSAEEQAITATAALRTELASLQQKEAELGKASDAYNQLAQQFPPSFQTAEWVTMVTSAASRSGAVLTTISPSVPQLGSVGATDEEAAAAAPVDPAAAAEETLATSTVNLTAEGDAESLREFLRLLNQMPRPILVEHAAITTDESTGGSILTVTGSTFMMRALENPLENPAPEGETSQEAPEVAEGPQ